MSYKSDQAYEASLSIWDLEESKADCSRSSLLLPPPKTKADIKVPRSRFRDDARVEVDYQRVTIDEGFMTVEYYRDTKRLGCNFR